MSEKKNKKCDNLQELLKKLPPNYPVGGVFLNGVNVPAGNFSNVCDCLVYFADAEGQITVVDAKKVDGISFGAVEEEE